MTNATVRFALPFILPGQAQKELYHNEALARIDAALCAAVEEGPLAAPPISPSPGHCWIVGDAAAGAWTGKDGEIASWSGSGWRFVAPQPGLTSWNKAAGLWLHYDGTGWSDGSLPAAKITIGGLQVVGPRRPAIPSPSNGTIIDAEARAAVAAIIATLMSHGLIE